MTVSTTQAAVASALDHIAAGRAVFPCVPGGKRPVGHLVPNGFHDASTDIELVRAWWRRCPHANLAISTGTGSFDVLDVDVKPAGTGYPALRRLHAAGLLPPPLLVVDTPSGGLHCYYRGTSQPCGALRDHFLDFKATGGYVLTPPSTVAGRPYRHRSRPTSIGHQLNWSAIRSFLLPPKPATHSPRPPETTATAAVTAPDAGVAGLARWLATQPKGNRNRGLFWACCRAAENGATLPDLAPLIEAITAQGLDPHEAHRTAADALRTSQGAT
ncbi:bifunctional DNA primase/polymerase [Nonomuraea typhae]|uniref:bifunctional DNA primase/polymerase n=1 Tax=Nonomuraea typhae TaxID=2603600 RepID=UPI0012FC8C73|nr:bifunctional DNA primase/polymerase [Nonomuraea typhae]